ncbi:MAG: hypothetical protein ACM33B_01100 [Pseudomonadota bacterium]
MLETLVLAAALASPPQLVVVPRLDLDAVAPRAAVGWLVPGAGPETSRAIALASLERGAVENSLRGGLPDGAPIARVRFADAVPHEPGVVVLELPEGGRQPNDRRYPIALTGASGLLGSDATRIDGLVAVADVARGKLKTSASGDPVGTLRELDDRIRDNGTARLPGSLLAAAIVVVLAFVRPRAAVAGLATGALANLLLGVLGVSTPWVTIPLLALGTLAGLWVAPTAALLLGTVAAYGVAMAVDASWVALSPLGPTQNARFYGISNLLETMLLPVALAGAFLLWRRFGAAGLGIAAAVALVTVAGSRFGADAGGAVVLLAGFGVLLAMLLPRRLALTAAAALVAVTALALVLGPATHLGAADLPGDLWDRVTLSWHRATDGWTVGIVTVLALGVLAVLVVRGPKRPLPLAIAAAIAVSMVVNDSPQDVALGGLVGFLALARWDEAHRVPWER